MMEINVPESQWQDFCDEFTRQHHGWLIGMYQLTTQTLTSESNTAIPAAPVFSNHIPLQEVREGVRDGQADFIVTVGEDMLLHSYLIEDVIALFNRVINGAHQGLRIDSADANTILLEFRTPIEPARLDGLAASEY